MHITVSGLWHLGSVTAACLAAAGHSVRGLDVDAATIAYLQQGHAPLHEPGLDALIQQGLAQQKLSFTTDPAAALANTEVLWITHDTPVDENDVADVASVLSAVEKLFPHLPDHALVLISSQLPVGSTRHLETRYAAAFPTPSTRHVSFAYSPENLRLGKAIEVFTKPDRIVVGTRTAEDRAKITAMLAPITDRIEWMSVESAEMTKHALNAFLATSVTFANEIATLCEQTGADAKEVERGLKSEARIGPKAYLGPGAAFAGGTLARDIAFLTALGTRHHLATPLLTGVRQSNDAHKSWPLRRLKETLGALAGKRIAILGLTYKPGTDTLRRSSAVELAKSLLAEGALVSAHDPAVKELPPELAAITLAPTPQAALASADAAILATEWPDYRSLAPADFAAMHQPATLLDPTSFLSKTLAPTPALRYLTVGRPCPS